MALRAADMIDVTSLCWRKQQRTQNFRMWLTQNKWSPWSEVRYTCGKCSQRWDTIDLFSLGTMFSNSDHVSFQWVSFLCLTVAYEKTRPRLKDLFQSCKEYGEAVEMFDPVNPTFTFTMHLRKTIAKAIKCSFCSQRYIVRCEKDVESPAYLKNRMRQEVTYDLSPIMKKEATKRTTDERLASR